MAQDYRYLADTADGACGVDSAQRIVMWNRAAERMLGFTSREAEGRYCFEMFCGMDDAGCRVCRHGCQVHTQALDGAIVPTRDLCVRSKCGPELWVNMTTLRMPRDADDHLTLVHLFRDISKQMAMQKGMRRLLDEGDDGHDHAGTEHKLTEQRRRKDLTSREREVLRLLATGASTTAIAETLVVSRATARNHIHNMLSKLNAHSRVEAVAVAWRDGLL